MDTFQVGIQIFTTLASQSPLLITYAVGAVLAMVYWRRDPGRACLVLTGCLICLLTTCVFIVINILIPHLIHRETVGGFASISAIFAGLGLLYALIKAAGTAMLLIAALRRPAVA